MTRPCKIGVQLPEVERFVPWPDYLDLARRAEAAGYDSIWVGDHLIYDLPDGSTRGPYEAWTTLAAIAAVTERVEIGPLVASTASTRRRCWPAGRDGRRDLAGQADRGARGGWNRREFDAFGFPYDRRVRASRRRWRSSCRCCGRGERRSRAVLRRRRLRAGPAAGPGGRPADHAGLQQPADAEHRAAGRRLVERLVEHLRQLGRAVRGGEGRGRRGHAGGRTRRRDGRRPGHVAGWCGRLMGEGYDARVTTITPDDLGDHVRGLANAGATHLQLVLDPITAESIDVVGEVLANL